jgi:hypothetical protein
VNSVCGFSDEKSSSGNFSGFSVIRISISGTPGSSLISSTGSALTVSGDIFVGVAFPEDLGLISSTELALLLLREFHLSLPCDFLVMITFSGEFQLSFPEERLEFRLNFFGEFQLSFSGVKLLPSDFSGELKSLIL